MPSLYEFSNGRIKVSCSSIGVNIFFDGREVTRGVGLNSAINSLGLWTDSTKADWQIVSRSSSSCRIKISFRELPLIQFWSLELSADTEILWRISLETEEHLYLDEIRALGLINSQYKSWVSGYEQAYFPRLDDRWHTLYSDPLPTQLVGVRFPIEEKRLPAMILESEENKLIPVIQNPPREINSHLVGFAIALGKEEKRFHGERPAFSGRISLFTDEAVLDARIENLRMATFKSVAAENKKSLSAGNKKINVFLVNLPWHKEGRWGVRAGSRWPHLKDANEGNYLPFPFFLACATSLLKKHGFQAQIIDAVAEEMSEDGFYEKIMSRSFDYLVAETSVPSFYADLKMLEHLHRLGKYIILCGPAPEIYKPEFLKKHSFIDFVLYGEYEFTLLELMRSLEGSGDLSSIRGLIYRNGDEVVKNPARDPSDLDLLPWPEREGLPIKKYWDMPGGIPYPSVQMFASRGCPFGCSFCLWPQVMYGGKSYRVRDVKDVAREMEYLVKKMGFKSVYFDDDTFNIGKDRMLEFSREIKKRGLEKIPWAIMARADLMDEEVLREMKSAGLAAVKYGVESFRQDMVDSCDKKLDIEKTTKIIKLTQSLGIKTHLTFTYGFSGETKDSIEETINYALRLDPDSVQFSILTPFPGTRLFEELLAQERILTQDWSKYDGNHSCVFRPDNLSAEDLEQAKTRSYLLWAEHKRRKRGLAGDIDRFITHLRQFGLKATLRKARDYLNYVWFKRRRYLNGTDR